MGVIVPEWGSRERVPHDRRSHDIGCDEMWRRWGLCTGQSWRSSKLCKGENGAAKEQQRRQDVQDCKYLSVDLSLNKH